MFSLLSNKKTGFTLIELLVVTAIIGVLSTVILAVLNQGRGKGNDGKVKSQLVSLRSAMELQYLNDPQQIYGANPVGAEPPAGATIGTGCNSSTFALANILPHVANSNYPSYAQGTGRCTVNNSGFAVSARLNAPGTFYCVDSRGAARQTNALHNWGTYVCP